MIHLYKIPRTDKSLERDSRLVVAKGLGERGMGIECFKSIRFPFAVAKMFWS